MSDVVKYKGVSGDIHFEGYLILCHRCDYRTRAKTKHQAIEAHKTHVENVHVTEGHHR